MAKLSKPKDTEVTVTTEVTAEVEVETTAPEIETETTETEVEVETEQGDLETAEVETAPEVTVAEPKAEVEVETETVDTSKKPTAMVKIKMRVDHKCCIAMERYDLKKDKTYTVPRNVKNILNKAGLLAPLN